MAACASIFVNLRIPTTTHGVSSSYIYISSHLEIISFLVSFFSFLLTRILLKYFGHINIERLNKTSI